MKQKMMQKIAVATISATLAIAPMMTNACTSMVLAGTDGGRVYGRTMEFVLSRRRGFRR